MKIMFLIMIIFHFTKKTFKILVFHLFKPMNSWFFFEVKNRNHISIKQDLFNCHFFIFKLVIQPTIQDEVKTFLNPFFKT